MAKQGLSGRGARPMTDNWNQDNGYRNQILDQTITVSIERLPLKLCLDQGKDETSMKAFGSFAFDVRDTGHVCDKIDARERSNEGLLAEAAYRDVTIVIRG